MQEDKFNMSMRKFLKQVGVTSQREIERIVREQRPARGPLRVKMVLTAEGTNLHHIVEDEIDLDLAPSPLCLASPSSRVLHPQRSD
jgi:hypothetical protein